MTRKLIALLLTLVMLCSVCAFASAEGEYAEHMEISIGTASALSDDAWASNYFNKMIQEKFNVTFVPYSSAAGFDEVTNLWISTGDMPEWITAGVDLEGMMSFAEQGMLAGLPQGWEERYPALAKEVKATGLEAYCTDEDGTWYILPRVVFSPNFPLSFADHATDHVTQYYRTDWVEEKIPEMITLEELKPIVEKVIADKAAAGEKIYGVSTTTDKLLAMFVGSKIPYFKQIIPVNGEYVLAAAQPGVVEGIRDFKIWYQEGLIDPDFFSRHTADTRNIFFVGGSFMTINDGAPAHANVLGTGLMDANPEMTEAPAMDVFNILAPNGSDYFAKWSSTFWRTLVFSPELENEPEKFERILAIIDYLAQPECVVQLRLGEQGVNWDYDENGRPYVISAYEYNDGTGANMLYHLSPSSQDAYGYGFNPSIPGWAVDMSVGQMAAKGEYLSADKMPTSAEYSVYDRWTGDNKVAFKQIGWDDEIVRIVLDDSISVDEVEAEWNNFIEANKGLWQPLLDEMNASR